MPPRRANGYNRHGTIRRGPALGPRDLNVTAAPYAPKDVGAKPDLKPKVSAADAERVAAALALSARALSTPVMLEVRHFPCGACCH